MKRLTTIKSIILFLSVIVLSSVFVCTYFGIKLSKDHNFLGQDRATADVLAYASKHNEFSYAGLLLDAQIPDKTDKVYKNNVITKVVKMGFKYDISITSAISISDNNPFAYIYDLPEDTSTAEFVITNDCVVKMIKKWDSDWTLTSDCAGLIMNSYLSYYLTLNNTFVFLSKTYTLSGFTLSSAQNPAPQDFIYKVIADTDNITPKINLPDDLNNISSTIEIKPSGITEIKHFGDNLPKTYNQDLAKNDALKYVATHNTFSASSNSTKYTVSNFAVKSVEQQSDSSFTVTITGDVTPKSGTHIATITISLNSNRIAKIINDWTLNSI